MNELQIIKNLGAVTSADLSEIMQREKSLRAIIRNLNNLEIVNEIKIVTFSTGEIKRRVYCSNEIYNNIHKIKKS
jgi:hypothetical protein